MNQVEWSLKIPLQVSVLKNKLLLQRFLCPLLFPSRKNTPVFPKSLISTWTDWYGLRAGQWGHRTKQAGPSRRLVGEEDQNGLENQKLKLSSGSKLVLNCLLHERFFHWLSLFSSCCVADRDVNYFTRETAQWGPGTGRPGLQVWLHHLLTVHCRQHSPLTKPRLKMLRSISKEQAKKKESSEEEGAS